MKKKMMVLIVAALCVVGGLAQAHYWGGGWGWRGGWGPGWGYGPYYGYGWGYPYGYGYSPAGDIIGGTIAGIGTAIGASHARRHYYSDRAYEQGRADEAAAKRTGRSTGIHVPEQGE